MSVAAPENEACNFANNGQLAVLHCKIKENAQCINAKDQADRTSLSWAAAAGKQEVVDFLVDNNGIIECSDESGWTLYTLQHSLAMRPLLQLFYPMGPKQACTTTLDKRLSTMQLLEIERRLPKLFKLVELILTKLIITLQFHFIVVL